MNENTRITIHPAYHAQARILWTTMRATEVRARCRTALAERWMKRGWWEWLALRLCERSYAANLAQADANTAFWSFINQVVPETEMTGWEFHARDMTLHRREYLNLSAVFGGGR
jgi:hypothetical protein